MSQKRSVGPVTGASAVGGSLGAAIGQLVVHFFPTLQPVETAVTVIITAILAVVGGWLVPPKDVVSFELQPELGPLPDNHDDDTGAELE